MICLDPDTEIMGLVLWAYMEGYTDAIHILENTKPNVETLREAFKKILKERLNK